MNPGDVFGKMLIYIGIGIACLGLLIWGMSRILPLGRLPGDIFVQREGLTVYFPIVTCIILSVILTVLLNLFRR
ncbi:MAG TPA: DUF2905 domain-containing protein [Clostridia bacterium]|nr:DUF2905 domain-containing protein [Clostridia bacterium]